VEQSVFGPISYDPGWEEQLEKSLVTIVGALNLHALAEDTIDSAGSNEDSKVRLDVRLEKKPASEDGFSPVQNESSLKLTDKDRVKVVVHNKGPLPVDVTVLYIESGFRIISYFPTLREAMSGKYNNRVESNKSAEVTIPINDRTVGREELIVIGMVGDPKLPAQNFAFLQQDGLQQARETEAQTRGAARSMFKTPLGELVAKARYGGGTRGGGTPLEIANYDVQSVTWLVTKRP
jgi:hypothetical protein